MTRVGFSTCSCQEIIWIEREADMQVQIAFFSSPAPVLFSKPPHPVAPANIVLSSAIELNKSTMLAESPVFLFLLIYLI